MSLKQTERNGAVDWLSDRMDEQSDPSFYEEDVVAEPRPRNYALQCALASLALVTVLTPFAAMGRVGQAVNRLSAHGVNAAIAKERQLRLSAEQAEPSYPIVFLGEAHSPQDAVLDHTQAAAFGEVGGVLSTADEGALDLGVLAATIGLAQFGASAFQRRRKAMAERATRVGHSIRRAWNTFTEPMEPYPEIPVALAPAPAVEGPSCDRPFGGELQHYDLPDIFGTGN